MEPPSSSSARRPLLGRRGLRMRCVHALLVTAAAWVVGSRRPAGIAAIRRGAGHHAMALWVAALHWLRRLGHVAPRFCKGERAERQARRLVARKRTPRSFTATSASPRASQHGVVLPATRVVVL